MGIGMRVFISWSGQASRMCAEALRDWLPYMNQAIEPFVSSQDISKGERGLDKIANELNDCTYGIVCVTRENQSAPWINFESGALSRELGKSMLAPFLLDLAVKDLTGPVAQFQATESSSKSDVWALVKSMNSKCDPNVDGERLEVVFNRFWTDLDESLIKVRAAQPENDTPVRETPDILNELVALVREQTLQIRSLESRVQSSRDVNSSTRYTIDYDPYEARAQDERELQRQRINRFAGAVARVVGQEHMMEMRIKTENDVQFTVTPEGLEIAQAQVEELQAVASKYRIGGTIALPGRKGQWVSMAPF
ncbi:TIR domain-containing protein [Streptomyces sp. NPDC051664]|uniref:TIR domain-containing protein n=1 Tax=Streptomyces sp. NPDC051664 TaxID=3365668 RepID=UPI0037A859AF